MYRDDSDTVGRRVVGDFAQMRMANPHKGTNQGLQRVHMAHLVLFQGPKTLHTSTQEEPTL